jgi:hypothetical protein
LVWPNCIGKNAVAKRKIRTLHQPTRVSLGAENAVPKEAL